MKDMDTNDMYTDTEMLSFDAIFVTACTGRCQMTSTGDVTGGMTTSGTLSDHKCHQNDNIVVSGYQTIIKRHKAQTVIIGIRQAGTEHVGILMNFSSPPAPEFDKMTTSDAANDKHFIPMTTRSLSVG